MSGNRAVAYMGPKKLEVQNLDFPKLIDPRGKDCHHGVILKIGMVFINYPVYTFEDIPFGGTKKSGYGRETGALGIQEFLNKKVIRVRPDSVRA